MPIDSTLTNRFSFAIRSLARNRRRTAIALVTIVGGLVAYSLAGGFINWVLWAMREATILSQLGHVQITRPDFFERGIANPYEFLLPPQAEALTSIRNLEGVVTATERLAFAGLASHGEISHSFLGEGVDTEREPLISKYINIASGTNLLPGDAKGILMGQGLATKLGVTLGDPIVLLATKASGQPGAIEGILRGTFTSVSKEYDDNALRIPLAQARQLIGVDGSTTWVALFDDTDQTEILAAKVSAIVGKDEYEITQWRALADYYNQTEALFRSQVTVVQLIIFAIIVLTISNTLTMSVMERTREIGTMMALGASRSGVLATFLLEGLVLGVVGGVLGIVAGGILSSAISWVGIPMPPAPGTSEGYLGEILFDSRLATEAFIIGALSTLVASVLPSWKASRMEIVDALRHGS